VQQPDQHRRSGERERTDRDTQPQPEADGRPDLATSTAINAESSPNDAGTSRRAATTVNT
jgi:hypothetical protein